MLNRTRLVVGALVGIVVVLLALQTPILRSVKALAWNRWVSGVARAFGVGDLEVSGELQTQLNQLQSDNARLRAELTDYGQLREQLGNLTYDQMRVIPAQVILKPDNIFQTEWILNKGAKDGVVPNAPITVYGSTLAGFVTEVHDKSAVGRLMIDPSFSIPAMVNNEAGNKGLASGQSYTSIIVETIPRDADIQVGQEVVTAGQGITPPGLLLGRVKTVRNEENEAYQEARLELGYVPNDVQAVNILVEP